jgi:hypothetical protein
LAATLNFSPEHLIYSNGLSLQDEKHVFLSSGYVYAQAL